jgi:molecular chaperone DnaJ
MTEKNYYNTLGIQKNASTEEIKKAYKQLAKKYHPDISKEPNAEQKFKEVQEAYSILSDPTKRQNYDQFGSASQKFTGFKGFNYGDFSNMEFDFEDLFNGMGFRGFSDMFGMGQKTRKRRPQHGEDIAIKLTISFMEAAFGTQKDIIFERIEECEEGNGNGAKKGTHPTTCPNCNGKGIETKTIRTILGIMQTTTTCTRCKGEGTTIKEPCPKCKGRGKTLNKKKATIKIPAGIDTGNRLRMNELGNTGDHGTTPGDLHIIIAVEPHDTFKRDGPDIFIEMPISFAEATLGTEIETPTLKGKAKLKIPPGTQTGTIFKMKNQGIKELNSNRTGDQYVKVYLRTPEKLNKKQRELFEQLYEEEKLREKRKGIFDKIKDTLS